MKRKIIGVVLIVLGIISLIILMLMNTKEKITLTSKYYKEESGSFIDIKAEDLPKDENYILYTYNSYCSFPIPCDSIFEAFAEQEHIDIVTIPFKEFKKTDLYPKVKYAPSVIVVKKKKIIAYLDANSDKDKDCYQDVDKFIDWIKNYVELSK